MTDEEYKQSQVDIEEAISMARQKHTAPDPIELPPLSIEAIDDDEDTPLRTATQFSADFALANQLLGRIQFAQSFEKLLTVSRLLDIKKIKDSKIYKHLPITTAEGEVLTVSSFDKFCECLGVSPQHINEQLRNLDAFGEEGLQSLQQMGLTVRQLRGLRKLPDDDRNLVIEQVTVDTGNKEAIEESILALLETQTRKNDAEKKEIEAEKTAALQAVENEKFARAALERKLKQELADKDALLEVKNKKIEELHSSLSPNEQTPDERVAGAEKLLNEYFASLVNGLIVRKSELTGDYAFGGIVGINALFAKVTSACGGEIPEHLQDLIKSQVERVRGELSSALLNIGLDDEAVEFEEYVPDANDVPFKD